MKILVTGCAGFIGFHLSNFLLKKNFVVGIDNINDYYSKNLKLSRIKILKKNSKKKFNFIKIDISDHSKLSRIFKKYKFDIVINLAAQAGVRYSLIHPEKYVESNLNGFFNILDLSKSYNIKHLLYASTSSVYGKRNLNNKLSEKDRVDYPIQFYAATKKSNELMAHAYSSLYKIPTTGLRFFTVYGPWGRPDMALFKFTKNILENKKIDIFNKGNHERDFTYVEDVVKIVAQLIKKKPKIKKNVNLNSSNAPYRIINIGYDKPVGLLKFIKILEDVLGKKSKKNFLSLQKGDVIKTQCDTRELRKIISIKPTSLEKGISNFVNWYKDYYNIKNNL